MSDFTDAQDRFLVQAALQFELANTEVSWSAVCKGMPHWKGQNKTLKYRLKRLKARFGDRLCVFPARYFQQEVSRQLPRCRSTSSRAGNTASKLHHSTTSVLHGHHSPAHDVMNQGVCSEIVHAMFDHVSTADVRQEAGRMDLNMGEITALGVNKLIEVCEMRGDDVFLDVGSGIGNVLAQVSLQVCVKELIGIEVRANAISIGRVAIATHKASHPQLGRISLLHADVRDLTLVDMETIEATHSTLLLQRSIRS